MANLESVDYNQAKCGGIGFAKHDAIINSFGCQRKRNKVITKSAIWPEHFLRVKII